jgi:hypothetical protein
MEARSPARKRRVIATRAPLSPVRKRGRRARALCQKVKTQSRQTPGPVRAPVKTDPAPGRSKLAQTPGPNPQTMLPFVALETHPMRRRDTPGDGTLYIRPSSSTREGSDGLDAHDIDSGRERRRHAPSDPGKIRHAADHRLTAPHLYRPHGHMRRDGCSAGVDWWSKCGALLVPAWNV